MLELKPHEFFPNEYRNLANVEKDINQIDREINILKQVKLTFTQQKVIEPIDPAYIPSNPVGPPRGRNMAVAGVLGIFLGTLFSFLVENITQVRED